jgi:transketolase
MIIAKTIKGKGVSLLEDKNGWHGKVLTKEECEGALRELGEVDWSVRGELAKPEDRKPAETTPRTAAELRYAPGASVATRRAYGNALVRIFPRFPELVVLDGEVGNSTYAGLFGERYPDHFFEMYVAEQNMVGTALGLARRGRIPFVSTFAAFFTRAFDQIRMAGYSGANIKFAGSHAGVSIGEDGPSQMGLEDIALFRTIPGSVVLYPADAVAAERLVEEAAEYRGIVYLRTTRRETPVIYDRAETFVIGGSKVPRETTKDRIAVVTAGVTLFEALAACEALRSEGIFIRVIDLYSIKPMDGATLKKAAETVEAILTVEDHYPEGGLGEAVRSSLAGVPVPVHVLAVGRMPKSGKPEELLAYEGISREAIIRKTKELLCNRTA